MVYNRFVIKTMEEKNMITRKELLTINVVPGKEIAEVLGYVKGSTVQTKNVGKDILAGFKSLIGGEINSYTDMMNEARQIATERLLREADELGADAVIGFRLQTSAVMGGAAEIIAYGTAVKLK
jgi:uncharacterized protein YbjQ (UPF0145 family)